MMAKKIILLIGMCILFSFVVYGVDENDTLTQSQVDNIPTDLTPQQFINIYKCQMENNGAVAKYNNVWFYYKRFSCLSITDEWDDKDRGDKNYLVIREHFTPNIRVSRVLWCIDNFTRAECISQVNQVFRQTAITNMNDILQTIKDYQTDGSDESLGDFNGGLW